MWEVFASDSYIRWAILIALVCVSIAWGLYMHKKEKQYRLESDGIFEQCMLALTEVAAPERDMTEYENKREEVFKNAVDAGICTTEQQDIKDIALVAQAWQRKVDPEDRKQLKILLLRRAFGNVPRWIHISGEINSKHRLYARGLLEPKAWMAFQHAQAEIQGELEYIRIEAECLEPEWGDKILKDAMILYKVQEAQKMRVKQQEEEKRQKDKEEAKTKEQEELTQRKAEEKADRLAEHLLREELNKRGHAVAS